MTKRKEITTRKSTQRERILGRLVERRMRGEKIPQEEFIKVGVSSSAVTRAMKAKLAGRPMGRIGAPPKLSEIEEIKVYSFIIRQPISNKPTLRQLSEKVWLLLLFVLFHDHLFSFIRLRRFTLITKERITLERCRNFGNHGLVVL